jgi:hypothetical protein
MQGFLFLNVGVENLPQKGKLATLGKIKGKGLKSFLKRGITINAVTT